MGGVGSVSRIYTEHSYTNNRRYGQHLGGGDNLMTDWECHQCDLNDWGLNFFGEMEVMDVVLEGED